MKRFVTVLTICGLLSFSNVAFAQLEYTTTVAGAVAWETPANWSVGGTFPGSGPGPGGALFTNSRRADHATISIVTAGTAQAVTYSVTSGSTNFNTTFVSDLKIDATGASNVPVSLDVTGDRLHVDFLQMRSGTAASENAKLTVSGVNSFSPRDMDLIGSGTSPVVLDIDEDVTVSGSTRMVTNVQVDVLGGKVLNVGTLILENGTTLDKLGTGVLQTS